MFIYENHLGGFYAAEQELDDKVLYCETCGDSDWPIGEAKTKEEAWELLKDDVDIDGSGGLRLDYVRNCINKWFGGGDDDE